MSRYLGRRLLGAVPVLWGVVTLVFLIIRLVPGDALQLFLGTQVEMTPEQMAELRRVFGLDRPLWAQYLDYLGRVVQGDLGVSLRTARSVRGEIASRLPVTVQLAVLAVGIAAAVAVPAGVAAAVSRRAWVQACLRVAALAGLSIPSFWLATMLVLGASRVGVRVLGTYVPVWQDPWRSLETLLLPAVALGTGLAAALMRYVRASVLEVLGQDYVRTAWAKGLPARAVFRRHVLRNALIPVVTVAGFQLGYLLGGAVVVEEVFGLPGMGRLALGAILQRDYAMLQGVVLVTATLFVLTNLLTDLAYGWIDPRIRYD
ncbi:MAG: ABC transporter permease [Armatimonadota bacterium]|nr:ABC transporter permease [Armatimonadota bacterium]MDR5674988.1 ABC transporter permease [Armatimonadota bacterium]MDR5689769.1 ABC transporter permease [Armatimonadota bacterium]MDR7386590.1 ABC transporter permease [Armatimonadota bacterium]MDR7388741.1 ABC transporter permease [Armatimonadota bacterium]